LTRFTATKPALEVAMQQSDIAKELAELKEQELKASRENDRDFYATFLADDAVAILPHGQFTKAEVLKSMTGDKAPFSAKRIENTKIRVLDSDAGIITYKAIYEKDGREKAVIATTVYQRKNGAWTGVLYQQTNVGTA
jgi:hypothetical protein